MLASLRNRWTKISIRCNIIGKMLLCYALRNVLHYQPGFQHYCYGFNYNQRLSVRNARTETLVCVESAIIYVSKIHLLNWTLALERLGLCVTFFENGKVCFARLGDKRQAKVCKIINKAQCQPYALWVFQCSIKPRVLALFLVWISINNDVQQNIGFNGPAVVDSHFACYWGHAACVYFCLFVDRICNVCHFIYLCYKLKHTLTY
jgi:hypothetical protein